MSDGQIRVNGQVFDSSCVDIRIGTQKYDGILGIKYSQKRERAKPQGLNRSRKPIALTPGKYNAEDASLTVLRTTGQSIRDDLAKLSADGTYGDVIFSITCSTVLGLQVTTDELRNCAIAGDDMSAESDNADPLKEEIPITVSSMLRNGKKLYSGKK